MHRRFFTAFAAACFAIALCASGCSGQGEGERCDRNDDNSGNDDCASGLLCYKSDDLGGVAAAEHTDLCCPSNRAQATTAICSTAISPANPGLPVDGGADTGVETDGGNDAASDAPGTENDAPLDSRADSPLDSPTDSPLDSPADSPLDSPAD